MSSVWSLYLVLNDVTRSIPLDDPTGATRSVHQSALRQPELPAGISVVQGVEAAMPVNQKRAYAVDLNDGAVRAGAEHRAALWSERIAARLQFMELTRVKRIAESEVPSALDHRDVLVDWVSMRRDLGAR